MGYKFSEIAGTVDPNMGAATGEGFGAKIQNETGMLDPISFAATAGDKEKRKDGTLGAVGIKLKKGGSIDGCAIRGRTKGRFV